MLLKDLRIAPASNMTSCGWLKTTGNSQSGSGWTETLGTAATVPQFREDYSVLQDGSYSFGTQSMVGTNE